MREIRVLIADDHKMVREGIKQLLELEGDIKVVGQANDGKECLFLINELNPDVTLLDINMPIINGLEVLEYYYKSNHKVKIILLTIHNEVEYLVKALSFDVDGYVLKDSDSNTLRKAILDVYRGKKYIEKSMNTLLVERNNSKKEVKKNGELTRRESEILRYLSEGLFNKEIAFKLSISEKTVKNHVSNIFRKIGVSDRTQAAVYAIKNNIFKI